MLSYCLKLSLFALVLGFVLYLILGKPREQFCLCTGARTKVEMNRKERKALYECGKLTEFTDLAGNQKKAGGPKWSTKSFGEYNPVRPGTQ